MKRLASLIPSLVLLLAFLLPASLAEPVKIACVGDSITFGYKIPQRETKSYPAQLQQRLDKKGKDKWEVRNFGVSSMTLMKKTSKSYWNRKEYQASRDYAADIVIIMLGTNDSNGMHRAGIEANFKADYHALVASYREGREEGEPRIILMLPPKCYLEGKGTDEGIIHDTIAPIIRQVAQSEKLELIDLYDALGTKWDEKLMPDKLHPSAEGAALMVKKIAPVVTKKPKRK